MYYSSIGVLAVILHMIINADTMFGKRDDAQDLDNKRYRHVLFAVMLYYLSDALWGCLFDCGFYKLCYVDTMIYFFAMGLTVFCWARFIAVYLKQNEFWSDMLSWVGGLILGAETFAIIINIFVPVMFYFTDEGEYVPSLARYIILYIQIVLFVFISMETLYRATKTEGSDKLHHQAIGASGLIMAFFVFLQAHFPLMPFYSIGCLIGTTAIHSFVVVEDRVDKSLKLGRVMNVAYKDLLTNVKNINAYAETKERVNREIKEGKGMPFAVAVFDLNDLKYVNDFQGHEAGDKYIRDGCNLICKTFSHSPVFRIGGDEFCAIVINDDYIHKEELMKKFDETVEFNQKNGGVVVSSGISYYEKGIDSDYDEVFTRADELMYIRKKELKKMKAEMKNAVPQ